MNSPSTLNGSKPKQLYPDWVAHQTPNGPHVRTISQLALFVHHDLHKFRLAGNDAVLTQALKLDFLALCPSLHLLFWELDEWLARGELDKVFMMPDLCAALSQLGHMTCTSTFVTRGSLYHKYMADMVSKQPHCSVCHLHTTAALAGLLCRLHGHRGTAARSGDTDLGNAQIPSISHGGRRIHPALQAPEGRPSALKTKGQGQEQPKNSAPHSNQNENLRHLPASPY